MGLFILLNASHALAAPWRLWITQPLGHPATLASEQFANEVNQALQHNHGKIYVYPNAVLGDSGKAVHMLQSGQLDFAEISLGPIAERLDALQLIKLPFLFRDEHHLQHVMNGSVGERYRHTIEGTGIVVLAWYSGGTRSFYCTDSTIKSVQDLRGKRIRVQGSIHVEMVKLLHAIPLVVPYQDVHKGLSIGDFDCAENNIVSFVENQHYQFAKTWLETKHMISLEALVVSQKIWKDLSPSEQQTLLQAAQKSATYMQQLWEKKASDALAIAKQHGVRVVVPKDLPKAIKQMEPLYRQVVDDTASRQDLLTILAP
ncbi:TRAP transporter substrate-binding protein DctP [Curvibacter sp. CHRR-16]|uniref:TRAP transporter substrate-binding protein DctP n=1 Tax=Curvibacter sp. CHRR-16 TaxID=2835872 RepID=UPI001BD9711B|nr:TRAP transporter substrate-binding protein DctP [Curvibacter sp. CHRR-16]MBT0569103.1 TRAP transporter substrate-binding protein DctP [Curvibacter sp. CHRR-16]